MAPDIVSQRQQLMDVGYVIVRQMLLPEELENLRQSADAIVARAPASGRAGASGWYQQESLHAAQIFCSGSC